jgi:hypothetical protein
MKNSLQQALIKRLWDGYIVSIPSFSSIFPGNVKPSLDHLAIIDLQSEHFGISGMRSIFEKLGFKHAGSGYLPTKQNDFIWMTSDESYKATPQDSLPQVVLADFRHHELSEKARKILNKYASYAKPIDNQKLDSVIEQALQDPSHISTAVDYIESILISRDWPEPSLEDYDTVKAENPLIAWVLLFGRKVNHFGFGIYTTGEYDSIHSFTRKLRDELGLSINIESGMVKGSESTGIEQSSTMGDVIYEQIDGTTITTHDSFMEFVWRHPLRARPKFMRDYHNGFVAENANNIIESLTADCSR